MKVSCYTHIHSKLVKAYSHLGFKFLISLCFLILFSQLSFAQQPSLSAEIDTSKIKIGEQIVYSIKVEADSTDLVVFPENTFAPMEMVESLKLDTARVQNRFRLLKEYSLTQFDTGKYTIPQQKIIINNREFLTDSMLVEVSTVVVDTTKQKMYPIKPSMEVPGKFSVPSWVWWLLGILLLAGLAFYVFSRNRKKKEAIEPELPPYEQAILELKLLDESPLLERREIKEYYSQLTASVRKFLDRKVYDRALESTTSELIAYLELHRESGKLELNPTTINDFKRVLQRADLAKFANSKPDVITAKEDRSKVAHIIEEVKTAAPEPTQDDLAKDLAYQEYLAKRKHRRRIVIGVVAAIMVIFIGITALVVTKGYTYLKDTVLGHPTKELLEGEWIRSEYGNPLVAVTTPKVLKRQEINLPKEAARQMAGRQNYAYGSMLSNFYIGVNTVKLNPQVKFDLDAAINGIYTLLEQQGAKNISMKQEEFTTLNGAKGIKVFGSLEMENPITKKIDQSKYVILNFAENQGFEQILIVYNVADTYAEEIAGRVVNSVELKNSGN